MAPPILIDWSDIVIEVDEALREGEESTVDLAKIVASIERLDVLPADLRIGDYVQRPAPQRALRVLETPHPMGLSGTYRIRGRSSNIGDDTLYRADNRLVPIVRGVPLGSRLAFVTAAEVAQITKATREGRAPGGAA